MYSSNQGQASGQAHTPTQSFGDSLQAQTTFSATGAPVRPVSAIWNDGKFREDYETCKSKMNDSKFNIRNYPDPLLPRQQSQPDFYPKGVTTELEAHLQGIIQEAKRGL